MTRVRQLDRTQLEEFEPFFKIVEQVMGFVPNSMMTMGRRPEILRGFAALSGAVLGPGQIAPELKQLVAFVSSNASGCRYCQAHTSSSAARAGASTEKIQAAFEYATSPLFSEAERAALSLANDASLVPNAASDAHFEELKKHFSEEQIVELMAVISLFGWLNRWNDTMATSLEPEPIDFARATLSNRGWTPAAHG
jgi:uncharacterized peroxidase-related enzyme